MTDTDYADLIRRFRSVRHVDYDEAADAIEALVKERDERKFICRYKNSGIGGNDPQDCEWPYCDCDPYANKVIAVLEENEMKAETYGQQFSQDAWESAYQRGLRDGERIGLEKAAKECRDAAPIYAMAEYSPDASHAIAHALVSVSDHIRTLITQEQSDDDKV